MEQKLDELPQSYSVTIKGLSPSITVVAESNIKAIEKAAKYFDVSTDEVTAVTKMWKLLQ